MPKTTKKPALTQPRLRGAARKAQLSAEAAVAEAAKPLMVAIARQADVEQATVTAAVRVGMGLQPAIDTAPVFTMNAVYHIFQQAWKQNGKRTAFTADQIHDLLVADGGQTK